MDFTTLIWLFLIFAAFTPALQRRYQEACRRFVIQRFDNHCPSDTSPPIPKPPRPLSPGLHRSDIGDSRCRSQWRHCRGTGRLSLVLPAGSRLRGHPPPDLHGGNHPASGDSVGFLVRSPAFQRCGDDRAVQRGNDERRSLVGTHWGLRGWSHPHALPETAEAS